MDTSSASNNNEHHIQVPGGAVDLAGNLSIPENARGIVLLPTEHTNNPYTPIARLLGQAGLATFLADLLTAEDKALDEQTGFFRENVDVLHQRVIGIANWLSENPETQNLRICYFGTGIMGATILVAAAERPDAVVAVASDTSRLDLAQDYIPKILAATLLLTDADNSSEVNRSQETLGQIHVDEHNKKIEHVRGLANLFENTSTQQEVARLVGEFFDHHLGEG